MLWRSLSVAKLLSSSRSHNSDKQINSAVQASSIGFIAIRQLSSAAVKKPEGQCACCIHRNNPGANTDASRSCTARPSRGKKFHSSRRKASTTSGIRSTKTAQFMPTLLFQPRHPCSWQSHPVTLGILWPRLSPDHLKRFRSGRGRVQGASVRVQGVVLCHLHHQLSNLHRVNLKDSRIDKTTNESRLLLNMVWWPLCPPRLLAELEIDPAATHRAHDTGIRNFCCPSVCLVWPKSINAIEPSGLSAAPQANESNNIYERSRSRLMVTLQLAML